MVTTITYSIDEFYTKSEDITGFTNTYIYIKNIVEILHKNLTQNKSDEYYKFKYFYRDIVKLITGRYNDNDSDVSLILSQYPINKLIDIIFNNFTEQKYYINKINKL